MWKKGGSMPPFLCALLTWAMKFKITSIKEHQVLNQSPERWLFSGKQLVSLSDNWKSRSQIEMSRFT